jgi:hypothetical protein
MPSLSVLIAIEDGAAVVEERRVLWSRQGEPLAQSVQTGLGRAFPVYGQTLDHQTSGILRFGDARFRGLDFEALFNVLGQVNDQAHGGILRGYYSALRRKN